MRPDMARVRRGLHDVASAIYREHIPLADLRMLSLGTGVAPQEMPMPGADSLGWRSVAPGTRWGGRDENAWFVASAVVPPAWVAASADGYAVALRLNLGDAQDFGWPEGLLYINGVLHQGINRWHPDVLLPPDLGPGQMTLAARVWSGMRARDHRIEAAELVLLSQPVERLSMLMRTGADLVDLLAAEDPLLYPLAAALDAAYDTLDLHDPASPVFESSARVALAQVEQQLANLRRRFDVPGRPRVTAVGHGHLDVAWKWQTRHTREKTARTFSIATALIERFPDYIFLHTTPQVYDWLRADYPDLYARVRERVRAGQFEAAGAMWLESDCNLVAGESLVRQIYYGERFLQQEFGRRYDVLWLPDAFGYSAALPQLLLRSGITAFMTTKLSWSEVNRIPADTFRWRGLDGSETLGHFITTPSLPPPAPIAAPDPENDILTESTHGASLLSRTDTYNGVLTAAALRGLWARYHDKGINDELLLAFGYGDGGAGPTRQQVLQGQALMTLPGLPELRFGRADEYFGRLRERVWQRADLPVWDGELYLEYHRGTYTTQAWLKRAHRQNEQRLITAELLDAWRYTLQPESAPDLRPRFDTDWQTLLLHEFHDILPGSSITEVYEDARQAMTALASDLDVLIGELLAHIARLIGVPVGHMLVINPAPFARAELACLPTPEPGAAWADATSGMELASQDLPGGDGAGVVVALPEVPALGYRVLRQVPTPRPVDAQEAWDEAQRDAQTAAGALAAESRVSLAEGPEGFTLENALIRVSLTRAGEVVSLIDLRTNPVREVVLAGHRANHLQLFDDRPRDFDAWDVDPWYERKPYAFESTHAAVSESGPLRASIEVTHTLGASSVTQVISLTATAAHLTFATRIDWHHRHLLLKAAFPLDVRARSATFETQFGAIARPTTRNTSWESAQFEVPAHRWADLSEADYGVSLLNDGRYGHDAHESTLRLTLLRSPAAPDPQADQGISEVTYRLLPHRGDWRADTLAAAYALNALALTHSVSGEAEAEPAQPPAPAGEPTSLFRVASTDQGVVISAIKRAADGDGLIVRVYQGTGARVWARLEALSPVERVIECDLLERPLTPEESPAYALWAASAVATHEPPSVDPAGWNFQLRPFEVRTFRVWCLAVR